MSQGEKTTSQEMGEALKERRQALRMSQEAVASNMGCSSSHLSRIERGATSLDIDLAERLQNFYSHQEKSKRGCPESGQTALGKYLTRLRKEKGGVPGVSNQYLRKLETGRRYPSIEVLKNIATAYSVPLQELLDILEGSEAPQEKEEAPNEKEERGQTSLTTENMRGLREKEGMSLSDVCSLIGVSTSHLSKVERGIAKLQPGAMKAVADLFGCDLPEGETETVKEKVGIPPAALYVRLLQEKDALPPGGNTKLLMNLMNQVMLGCLVGEYAEALLRVVAYGLKTLEKSE